MKFLVVLFSFVALINTGVKLNQSYSIKLKITNVRNSSGRIQVQFYRSQESFDNQTPWKVVQVPKGQMKEKTIYYEINDIPEGTYGIAVLDDENSNKEMDYSLFKPKEGFGFSNYYHTAWSKPKFDDFKFLLNKNTDVSLKLRYV